MEIQLKKSKEIILVKEEKFTATSMKILLPVQHHENYIEVDYILTDGENEQKRSQTLWDGKEMKELGTYTIEDVKKRLEELL